MKSGYMIMELGIIQKLKVVRKTSIGIYVKSQNDEDLDAILLPNNQLTVEIDIDEEIEVFVYRDSEDRMIATQKTPLITIGELAVLRVVGTTSIGAFLDWGLEKDLFLPFKEQSGNIMKDCSYLVGLYIDKSDRLCATMNVYNVLSSDSPYKKNDWVKGIVYNVSKEMGAFVAVDNKYQGLIPSKEIFGSCSEGDCVDVRVKMVKPDGKLDLSLREEACLEIEGDSRKIMERIELGGGTLLLNDSSAPEQIKSELAMSKKAFKRAVGRLLKEGAIKITDDGIERLW